MTTQQITDCHIHVIDPAFPMKAVRSYTPKPIVVSDVRDMMHQCGVSRVVLIQISVYGNDNTAMLHALDQLGDTARGVIHLSGQETSEQLQAWHARNVRGVRINLVSTSESDLDATRHRLQQTALICKNMEWHIQLFALPDTIAALEDDLKNCTVPIVIDHFGLIPVSRRGEPGEQAVMRLLKTQHVWIKLSADYRLDGGEYQKNVDALIHDLAMASPETALWGSDWPHPPMHAGQPKTDPPTQPYRDIETHELVDRFRQAVANPQIANQILVENPKRLYDWR